MIDYAEGSGKQYHIGVGPEDIGKYVILPGDPARCPLIAEFFDDAKLVCTNREYTTYTGYLDGEKVSVMSTGMGGPSIAICLEELKRCGVHTGIRVGTCGGMHLDVCGGDIVIANGAIRMEGTTREFAPIEYPAVPHPQVLGTMVWTAEDMEMKYHVGVVHCKDSFYGQHQPELMPVASELQYKWEAWLKMGCLGSEMESAALFIVGDFLNMRVGTCLLALANQEREKRGLSNVQEHDIRPTIELAVETMRNLIKMDREKEKMVKRPNKKKDGK